MPLLALFKIPANLGYAALFLIVGAEASGVPLPGETALVTSSILASKGKLAIEIVIPLAAVAAIVGDNIGYVIGARFGRRLMTRPGRTQAKRLAALERGNGLMERHGGKTVFFGRWVAGLRVWASWLAGMSEMPWRQFLIWNALGGMAWATCFGLIGFYGGHAAEQLIKRVGLGAAAVVIVAVIGVYVYAHRRMEQRGDGALPGPPDPKPQPPRDAA